VITTLMLLLPSCGSSDRVEAGYVSPALEARFRAAESDPAQVVPLILEVSAHVAERGLEQAAPVADRLEPSLLRVFFSAEEFPGSERLGLRVHTVKKGEIPGRIVQRYGISSGLLTYLNQGYDERKLQVGQKLRVLDLSEGTLSVEVSRSRYRAAIWFEPTAPAADGASKLLLAGMPVGLGAAASPTPSGETRVTQRVRDPQWTHPETKVVYAPDDPGNVLGGYWIALAKAGLGKSGIGFHGYTGAAPKNWIEQPASNGCVRLLQADVDRLFHVALEGTRVVIR
jgi:lipoprotein-anchoring transpeptidase ErfK/SrfK